MALSPAHQDFHRLFIAPRFRRRHVLALCSPPLPAKALENWAARGLLKRLGLGQAADLRAQAAEAEANEAKGRRRLFNGWDCLHAQILNLLSWHALPLGLVGHIAPIALRMAQVRLAADAGDPLLRWAVAAVPPILAIARAPSGEWCVDVLLPGADRPYLMVQLDIGRVVDDLLVALTAEPGAVQAPARSAAEGVRHAA